MTTTAPSRPDAAFDQFAAAYKIDLDRSVSASGESGEYFAAYKARYMARLLGAAFDGRVLDFGCGVGLLSQAILQELPSATLTGYDPSARSIDSVPIETRAGATFTSDLAEVGCAYDAIVLANVLHHVPVAERAATIHGVAQRLAHGGRLFVFEHNPLNPVTRRAVRKCPFDEGVELLRPRAACECLRRAGLQLERRDYIVFFPHALRGLRTLEPHLRALALGAQYAMVGSRP